MNDLLDKYWAGETSLNEEQQLRDYFASPSVAPEHLMYRDLFATFSQVDNDTDIGFDAFAKVNLDNNSIEQEERIFNKKTWKGLAIAAGFSLLIAVGAGYQQDQSQPDLGTYDSPEQAYAATMEALELVSKKFNNGRENLAPAAQVNKKTTQIFKLNK
jgi:uncharacterized protein YjlB